MIVRNRWRDGISISCFSMALTGPCWAQSAPAAEQGTAMPPAGRTGSAAESAADPVASDEIIVTALKNAGTSVQKAPLAVSAFGAEALADQNVERLSDLTFNVPNVNLSSTTSFPGFSNYTIRGMAVYSTIPSSTPTVGVFVDEVYLGTPAGVGFNTFDLESVEVLRGPQGLFFGRNVTGGAVLARTSLPKDRFSITAEAGVETRANYTGSLVVTGPLTSTLSAKAAIYYNNDGGYFRNILLNDHIGDSETLVLRGALTWKPTTSVNATLRLEHGELNGDGAINQDHVRLGRGIHDFRTQQDTRGFIDAKWNQLTFQSDFDIGFGDGTITNIFGLRNLDQAALIDNDSSPVLGWNQYNSVKHEQISNELRYSGSFGIVSVTAGLFVYADDLDYVENRLLFKGATNLTGGGRLKSQTYAQFLNLDINVTDELVLSVGERWSYEAKQADIQALIVTAASPCSVATRTCARYAFPNNRDSWKAFTPRLGFRYEPDPVTNIYGFWTKGFRSGGYNLRVANPNQAPTPYDQEVVNTFEVGLKKRWFDNRLTTNVALFYNQYKQLQRDIQIFGTPVGTVQTTQNPADVDIRGIEFEGTLRLGAGFTLEGNFGYLDSEFKDVRADLSGNGTVGPEDFRLQLPFLSPWSYGVGVSWEGVTPLGSARARVFYSYKDPSASNDQNNRFLPPIHNIDANLSVDVAEHVTLSVYGQNLLNRVSYGFDNEFTLTNPTLGADNPLRSVASPLAKGRIFGAKVRYSF